MSFKEMENNSTSFRLESSRYAAAPIMAISIGLSSVECSSTVSVDGKSVSLSVSLTTALSATTFDCIDCSGLVFSGSFCSVFSSWVRVNILVRLC